MFLFRFVLWGSNAELLRGEKRMETKTIELQRLAKSRKRKKAIHKRSKSLDTIEFIK